MIEITYNVEFVEIDVIGIRASRRSHTPADSLYNEGEDVLQENVLK
jgi:hypothetical protein